MNLLLLGDTGSIGNAILDKFVKHGWNTKCLNSFNCSLTSYSCGVKTALPSLRYLQYDAIVNAAGINDPKEIELTDMFSMQHAMEVNALGFVELLLGLLPDMKKAKRGSIVSIGSLYSTFARTNRLPYVTSKHALLGAMQALALELAPYNIFVNTVSPGFVDTKLTRKNLTEKQIEGIVNHIPLGRLAMPEEIANIVYFLCSEQNTYITGQNLIVDGGYSIGGFEP